MQRSKIAIDKFHEFIDAWLEKYNAEIKANWCKYYDHSYLQWAKSSQKAWGRIQTGGTYQLYALIWYYHYFKPGSKEYRPKVIIDAILSQPIPLSEVKL